MPRFRINDFHGELPKLNRRQIPVGGAQKARNVRFDSGDLRPFQRPAIDETLLAGDIGYLFWYRHQDDNSGRYIAFSGNQLVHGFRSPVPDDEWKRWYWNQSGEAMRFISNPKNPFPPGGASPPITGPYRTFKGVQVGIPAPNNEPEALNVTQESAIGFDADVGITSVARTNPMTVNTDAPHEFEAGWRVRIVIDESLPKPQDQEGDGEGLPEGEGGDPSTIGQIWSLEGLEGTVSNVSGQQFDITGVSATNFEEFDQEDIDALRIERVITDNEKESRSYLWTYVSQFGEEGPPSPPSNVLNVPKEGAVVQLSIEDPAHDPLLTGGSREYINRIRVYRSAGGNTGTLWLFVGELPFAGGGSQDDGIVWEQQPNQVAPLAWSAELTESVPPVALGDRLKSEGWFPPPLRMLGIAQLANGVIAGWKDNTVFFTDRYLPHAWDPDYSITVEDEIIGAQSYGNVLVLGTRTRPYIVTGIDPSAMTAKKVEFHAPLIAKESIVDAGFGVLYMSHDGLVLISGSGPRYLTESHYTEQEWLKAIAGRNRIAFYDQIAFIYGRGQDILVLDSKGDNLEVSEVELDIGAATPKEGELAIVEKQVATGQYRAVSLFKKDDDAWFTGLFQSSLVSFRRPVNPAAAQVFAEGYPVTLTLRYLRPQSFPDPVEGQPDLEVLAEKAYTVKGPEPFWLEDGYLTREFEFEIETDYRVQEVLIATSINEIRQ